MDPALGRFRLRGIVEKQAGNAIDILCTTVDRPGWPLIRGSVFGLLVFLAWPCCRAGVLVVGAAPSLIFNLSSVPSSSSSSFHSNGRLVDPSHGGESGSL